MPFSFGRAAHRSPLLIYLLRLGQVLETGEERGEGKNERSGHFEEERKGGNEAAATAQHKYVPQVGLGKKGDPFSWPHKCRSAVVSRAGDAAANVAHLVRVARPP